MLTMWYLIMKNNKIIIYFVIAISLYIFFAYIISNRTLTYQKDIDKIYMYNSAFGVKTSENIYDFKTKEYWNFTSSDFEERDSSLENEGYALVCTLTDERIEQFLTNSARYGFTLWDESYIDDSILDGDQWGIVITFADGSEKNINGSNKYPITYSMMMKNFRYLEGEDF